MSLESCDQTAIVAIESSCRVGSVAVARGPLLLAEREFSADLRHAVELLPTIDELCADNGINPGDVEHVHVSGGPGSFTGLRIGITVARTLAWAVGAKVVRVPTIDVIAQNALAADQDVQNLAVILDAKRKQVYAGAFKRQGNDLVKTVPESLFKPADFLASLPRPLAVMGEGIPYHREAVDDSGAVVLDEVFWRPRAGTVHQLGLARAVAGRFNDPKTLLPIYIRRPEAEELWEKRHEAK